MQPMGEPWELFYSGPFPTLVRQQALDIGFSLNSSELLDL